MTHYGKMKMLMQIYNDMLQVSRIEARKERDTNEKSKQKYQKEIDKLNKKIDKNIEKYNQYEIKVKDVPIQAYVMLRSMEGQERLLHAYKDNACTRCCMYFCRKNEYKRKRLYNQWLITK